MAKSKSSHKQPALSVRQILLLSTCFILLTSVLSGRPALAAGGMTLEGVNISGAEFTPSALPGVLGTNYIYPTTTEIDFFAANKVNIIRVPFLWERMQPTAKGALSITELGYMDACVTYANSKGISVVLDPHNYGAYQGLTIGVPGGTPNAVFAKFWKQMATHYKNNPKVIFGLMNEPVGSTMTPATWEVSAQAAITAIRATGARNLILVPSTYWEHSVDFVELNAADMINITDPVNNWSYEIHQYLDYDGSGTHPDYPSVSVAVSDISGFTQWLQANNRTAFLGEIGVTSDSGALADLSAMLQYMHANPAQWTGFTYWTAGRWYPANYMFSVEPQNGQPTPQMQTLTANVGQTEAPPKLPPRKTK